MNLKIRTKIFLAFLLIIFVGVGAIVVNFFLLTSLSQKVNHIIYNVDPAEIAVFDLRNSFNEDISAIEEYANGFADLEETEKKVNAAEAKIEENIEKIENSDLGQEHLEDIRALKDVLAKDEMIDEKVFELKKSEKNKPTQPIISSDLHQALISFDLVSNEVSKIIDQISGNFKEHKSEHVDELENSINQSKLYIMAAFSGSILVALLLAFIVSFALSASIRKIRDAAVDLSKGDLTERLPVSSKDEIGELASAFNQMAERLQQSTVNLEEKVTERTKQLRQEHSKLEASINSLNLGFMMTDLDCNIVTINEAAKHLFCYRYEGAITPQMLTQSCTMGDITAILSEVYDLKAAIKQVLKQKIAGFKEVQIQSRFVAINISPIIVYEKGVVQTLGVVVLVQDITERRLIERTKDEFFSIASHELRTPLTAIRGNATMIKEMYGDKLPDKDSKEMLDDIHEASIRLLQIVNDFLSVSRLELGKLVFKEEAFDIEEITKKVVELSTNLVSQKPLSLQIVDPATPLPKVLGDSDRAKEVLLNLVSNAIKYSEKGEIKISFQVKDQYVYVLVKDSGRGIPIESQSLLFKKFQQASNNLLTRDTTKSTGLGLYISKMMMEGMGGRIGLLSSEENKGSTFYIGLPVAQQP